MTQCITTRPLPKREMKKYDSVLLTHVRCVIILKCVLESVCVLTFNARVLACKHKNVIFLLSNQFSSVHPVPFVFYFLITKAKPESVPVSTGQQVPYEGLHWVKRSNINKISQKNLGIHFNGTMFQLL